MYNIQALLEYKVLCHIRVHSRIHSRTAILAPSLLASTCLAEPYRCLAAWLIKHNSVAVTFRLECGFVHEVDVTAAGEHEKSREHSGRE